MIKTSAAGYLILIAVLYQLSATVVPSRAQDYDNTPRYRYKEDLSRSICLFRNGMYSYGEFDSAGNFVAKGPPGPRHAFETGPLRHTVGIPRDAKGDPTEKEAAYEYRSGLLIPGLLIKSGNFVPTEGAKVMSFKDYQFSVTSTRIYNLPGVFQCFENGKLIRNYDPAPF
jgi:hypothetical protein